jgi:hypothetical protein
MQPERTLGLLARFLAFLFTVPFWDSSILKVQGGDEVTLFLDEGFEVSLIWEEI